MADKERKVWAEEERVLVERVAVLESQVEKTASEMEERDETDKLVQGHV